MRIYADKTHHGSRLIALYGYSSRPGQAIKGLIVEDIKEMESAPAFTTLDATEAQILMDQLWNCGVRPSEGSGSAGSLAATQRHLEDMRSIVASKLAVTFPGPNMPSTRIW